MTPPPPSTIDWYDPFDLWAVPALGRIKARWYRGSKPAKLMLYGLYALDWFAPRLMRRLFRVRPHRFAHSLALLRDTPWEQGSGVFLDSIASLHQDHAWGLPFVWYSKNGVYPAGIPLVTAAPYVFQALLDIDEDDPAKARAMSLFHDSWHFLQSLSVHEDNNDILALSYAPFDDEVTVINANSYAAWSYAMHAAHGMPERREQARDRAMRLARWVVRQQNPDGSWYYLAQRGDWDMIDGFHSCFVVRNLRSAAVYLPEIGMLTGAATDAGWDYIRTRLFDAKAGLCRRYAATHRADPFRYDIYDQAEYLGLLVDFGQLDEACALAERVEERFVRRGRWHCRIDIFGRLWGRDFLRWGVVPFLHHRNRLDRALAAEAG